MTTHYAVPDTIAPVVVTGCGLESDGWLEDQPEWSSCPDDVDCSTCQQAEDFVDALSEYQYSGTYPGFNGR